MLRDILKLRASPRQRLCVSALLMAALLALSGPAAAVAVEGLYTAEVPFDPNDPGSRAIAYERALQQVLIRVTGSEDAAFSPELKALFPNPARFVMQFRPGEGSSLWVTLDGAAIEQVLRAASLPVWGNDRPLTVLWIAVDWGQGQRELLGSEPAAAVPRQPAVGGRPAATIDGEQALRERILRVANARGVPVRFPTLAGENDDISLSDVWGGFHERLMDASRSYNASSMLVGRLRPDDAGRNRWNYYVGGQQRQWSGDIEDAIHLLADTLAGEFAFAGNAGIESVLLNVSNIGSVKAFAAVQGLVDGLDMVDAYTIDTVNGSQIQYAIRVNGGARRLASVLDLRAELMRTEAPRVSPGLPGAGSADTLYYDYRP